MIIKNNVKYYRLAAGITRQELSSQSQICVSTITSLEDGLINPRLETLYWLSKALGCAAKDLIDFDAVSDDVDIELIARQEGVIFSNLLSDAEFRSTYM